MFYNDSCWFSIVFGWRVVAVAFAVKGFPGMAPPSDLRMSRLPNRVNVRWAAYALFFAPTVLPAGAMHVPVHDGMFPPGVGLTLLVNNFGLQPNATITIDLRTPAPASDAHILILTDAQLAQVRVSSRGFKDGHVPCAWRASLVRRIQMEYRVASARDERYHIGLLTLVPHVGQGLVGEVELVNPDGNQLSVQQRGLDDVAYLFAFAFSSTAVGLTVMLLWALHRGWGRPNHLHGLLFAMLLLKSLVLWLLRRDVRLIALTGVESLGRHVTWSLLRQVQQVLELLLFYVIALGWKIIRPELRHSEWVFALSVVVPSMLLGCMEVGCNSTGACSGQTYHAAQFTLQSLCYLIVIVATNFNIFVLQREIAEALARPSTGTLYAKYRTFCFFRMSFLLYILIPSFTEILALQGFAWNELRVVMLLHELMVWVVLTGVCWLVCPGVRLKVFGLTADTDSEHLLE